MFVRGFWWLVCLHPVKRMVRAVSDFRADKTSHLRAAALPKSSKPGKWDWALVNHRWHLITDLTEWVGCGLGGEHWRVGGMYGPPWSGWNH